MQADPHPSNSLALRKFCDRASISLTGFATRGMDQGMRPGTSNRITDIAGLRVGNAESSQYKTGVTVFVGDSPFTAGVHVMGGAPGTRETDLLAPDRLVQKVDALVLSGGSAFGLDSASGVADRLRELGRGYTVGPEIVPIVPSAILFDLLNGADKAWTKNPYNDLGRRALDSATADFKIGTAGAGTGATTPNLKGGLGSASAQLDNGFIVGALVAVNSAGSVTQHDAPNFWASPFEFANEFGGIGTTTVFDPAWEPGQDTMDLGKNTNTTIAIVATNASLNQAQAKRLAVAAHDGMARATLPSHTIFDGDLIFSAATGEKPLSNPEIDLLNIGHAAASCLARAIARGVYFAVDAEGDTVPTWRKRFGEHPR